MKQIWFLMILFIFPVTAQEKNPLYHAKGKASFYARSFEGKKTSNGETFTNKDFTAAHRSLPFNTLVRVLNPDNGRSLVVRINDRGPYIKNRIIDLTQSAARRLGLIRIGIDNVIVDELNILRLTPEIEKVFISNEVVDCLGNKSKLADYSISLWSTSNLLHAIYMASDMYLQEDVPMVYISGRGEGVKRKYFIVLSEIDSKEDMKRMIAHYKKEGFEKTAPFN